MNFDKIIEYLKENMLLVGILVIALVLGIILVIILKNKKTKKVSKKKITLNKEDVLYGFDKSQEKFVVNSNKEAEVELKETTISEAEVEESSDEEEINSEETKDEEINKEEPSEEEITNETISQEEIIDESKNNNLNVLTAALVHNESELIEMNVQKKPAISKTKKEPEILTKSSSTLKGKYEVNCQNSCCRYVLKASNGEVLVESEIYETKEAVFAAIETVKKNIGLGEITIFKDKRDLFQFKLTAKNSRVLVISANYNTEKDAIRACESFKRFAVVSPVVEVEGNTSNIELVNVGNIIAKKGGKVDIITSLSGEYLFQLKASNGAILCTSVEYKSKAGANGGIATFKNAIKDGKFYVLKDKRDNFQFKLYSTSNRVIAVGESYSTKIQAVKSVTSVCSFIELAEKSLK